MKSKLLITDDIKLPKKYLIQCPPPNFFSLKEWLGVNTLKKAYINYFDFDSELTTIVSQQNTWYKLNTSTTKGFSLNGLVHSNNRVTNTGVKKIFKAEGIVSVGAGNGQEIHAAFFKNGALFPCSEQSSITDPQGKKSAVPFHCLIELDTNDFIEVFVKNKLATTNITLDNINVILTEMG
jgi:hypothetical protein